MISAFCFFRVSNRHTFGAIFDRDLSDPKLRKRHKKMIIEAVERMLEAAPGQELIGPRASRVAATGTARCAYSVYEPVRT